MKNLEGRVALVTEGGHGLGKAVALALGAAGAKVVITGAEERLLGETVGEIACGGGKARHVAGDARDAVAVARALEVFGGLDIVVAAGASGAARVAFEAALARIEGPMALVVTAPDAPSIVEAFAGRSAGVTCTAVTCPEASDAAFQRVAHQITAQLGRT